MSDSVDLSGKGGSLIQRDEAPDFLAQVADFCRDVKKEEDAHA